MRQRLVLLGAVTVAAEGLVKELKVDAAEEIFTAALLHDVGKLV